jgi:hypothetical protein
MNLRSEWKIPDDEISNRFYNKTETINEVKENFDIRRQYSAEGKQLTINNTTDWCLVQTSSNPLKQFEDLRKICCPLTMTVNHGDYVTFDDSKWLIDTNVINIDEAYLSTRMSRCNYLLKWQNASGTIIERDCVESRISTVGIDENKVIQIGKSQSKILIPYDSETIKLRVGKRFYIDNNTENPTPYEITLANTTQYVKNGHGYLEFIVTETATIPEVDRPDLMLCNYISPTTPPDPETTTKTYIASISYTQPEVAAGSKFGRNFTAVFKDADGNVVTTLTPKWTITADFMDNITATEYPSYIKIVIMDTSLIDKTFKLKLEATDDSAEPIEMTILITSIYG